MEKGMFLGKEAVLADLEPPGEVTAVV